MNPFKFFRRDPDALDRAKKADAHAGEQLRKAERNAAWARVTVDRNHLTERFFATLRHEGKI